MKLTGTMQAVNIRALEGSIFIQLQTTIGTIRIDGPIWIIPSRRARKVKRPAAGRPGDDQAHSGKQRLQERNADDA